MPINRAVLAMAALSLLLVACSGGSNATPPPTKPAAAAPTIPAAPRSSPTPQAIATAASPAVDALMTSPCGLLSDAALAPLGGPVAPGIATPPSASSGITSAECRWNLPGDGYVRAVIFISGAGYTGPADYMKQSLYRVADSTKASPQDVSGIGDYAGYEIPPQLSEPLSQNFVAQKGNVGLLVMFSGPPTATWPTADQLQALGTAAAARIF